MGIGILVGVIFVLIAGGLAFWNHTNIKKAKAAEAWPKCRGKILEHRVDHKISRSRKGGTTHTYEPVISYSYDHNGQTYSGARLNYSNVSYHSQQSAQHALNAYPVGSEVDVLVNPADAGDCTLSATAKVSWLLPIIFGIAGVGAVVLFAMLG